jgi:hypothetical protein
MKTSAKDGTKLSALERQGAKDFGRCASAMARYSRIQNRCGWCKDDLVLHDTLVESVAASVLGLVLTEWKLGDEKNAEARLAEASKQNCTSQVRSQRLS